MPDLRVFEFIEQVKCTREADEVWRLFLNFVGRHGYTNGGLADMPGPLERLEEKLLFLDWPDEWAKRYMQRNYVHEDPARLHLAQTSAPYHWSDMLTCSYYSKRQKNIVHEASEFSLRSGYIIPFASEAGGQAMVTVAGDQVSDDPLAYAEIQLAAMYVHAQIRALSSIRATKHVPQLSMRERECLQWAASGKSDWEIGEILSISEKTAGTHLERVKRKYGVATRLQAVVAGLRSGYVHA
jgi:LuxR family quorum sensing-dependent transcriptional regulator